MTFHKPLTCTPLVDNFPLTTVGFLYAFFMISPPFREPIAPQMEEVTKSTKHCSRHTLVFHRQPSIHTHCGKAVDLIELALDTSPQESKNFSPECSRKYQVTTRCQKVVLCL
jgi:hypothetical protein